jgi:thymidine kinase
VDKTLAICMQCGAPANRSQRLIPDTHRVVVGGAEEYEARCRRCFQPGDNRSQT